MAKNVVPQNLKIFHILHILHILHIDRLESIINDKFLYCDEIIHNRFNGGTNIGMNHIKERRLNVFLSSYSDLTVGKCVPFYFCPRSVMLYVIKCGNHPDIAYCGGQENVIHLEFDMKKVLNWASANNKRCVFTTSSAGSYYFEDYKDFSCLDKINWNAINARQWQDVKEDKQAEFLIESELSWGLLERIGVHNLSIYQKVSTMLNKLNVNKPVIEIKQDWYY